MRTDVIVGATLLALAATAIPAQARPPQAPPPSAAIQTASEQPLALNACVVVNDTAGRQLTIANRTRRLKYRPRAIDLDKDAGQRTRVVGGLLPTPNIAAQAGSIDPTFTAMAMAGAIPTGIGNMRMVELHVTRVQPITGSCPQR